MVARYEDGMTVDVELMTAAAGGGTTDGGWRRSRRLTCDSRASGGESAGVDHAGVGHCITHVPRETRCSVVAINDGVDGGAPRALAHASRTPLAQAPHEQCRGARREWSALSGREPAA